MKSIIGYYSGIFGIGLNNFFLCTPIRKSELKTTQRGVRVAEGARLESVYTLKGIEGSNPSLSANRTNFRNEVGFFIFTKPGS